MLKLRILTAAVLIPLMVWAVYSLPTLWLGVLMGVFILAAAWEWGGLCAITQRAWRAIYVIALGLAGILLYRAPVLPVMIAAAAWWLLALITMIRHRDPNAGLLASPVGRLVSGFFVLVPAWLAALSLHAGVTDGWKYVLFIMVLVWTADSGAYFVGRPWGRTKIAPHISPGKSLEGVLGGLAAVLLVSAVSGVMVWDLSAERLIVWLVLCAVITLVSVIGDLGESRFKRAAGVKDSGNLLPGHGGVLDRIDAFTAAAPFFLLGCKLLGFIP
jgi:phosphatidate cytidylyltransferase